MTAWNRDTPWRQGHVLTSEASIALGVLGAEEAKTTLAIVISHDCDLAQSPEVEPAVEIVLGKRVGALDGNYTHAKNSRRLHLECTMAAGAAYLDIHALGKREVRKTALAEHRPDGNVALSSGDRSILQRWLAARYRRSAFPDEFERRLNDTGVTKRLVKILAALGKDLVAVFFDVDEGEERNREGEQDPYVLTIDLLYSTEDDPDRALASAKKAAGEISAVFRERCFDEATGWSWIQLASCEPIADEAMTYATSMQLKRWNMDYLSLRADPPEEPMREQ